MRQAAKAALTVPLWAERLFLSGDARYLAARRTLAGNHAGDYWTSDVVLLLQGVDERWDMTFGVYNVFSENFGDPGAEEHVQDVIERNGREFMLQAVYRFDPVR